MAKHDTDPVLKQLVQAINESGQAAVPVTVCAHGTLLNGALIAERRYFSELVEGSPLMSALDPSSGLLGKEAKETEAESGHYLHLRTPRPWRRGRRGLVAHQPGSRRRLEPGRRPRRRKRGPFARLLGTP